MPACVVLRAAAARYPEVFSGPGEAAPPVLLFSWADPAFIPAETVLVFDDSPWSQILSVYRMLKKGETRGLIPSEIRIVASKDRTELIKSLKMLIFEGFQADN
jgi:hypothetical protein